MWLSQDLMVRENAFEQMFSDFKSAMQCHGKSMDFAVWQNLAVSCSTISYIVKFLNFSEFQFLYKMRVAIP